MALKQVFEVLMTSQWRHKSPDQKYDWVQAVFYSLTHREQYSAVKPFSEKNAERFEIATRLHGFKSKILSKYVNILISLELMLLKKECRNYPWTQDVNWTYIRRSEDVHGVFWTSHIRSIYVLCPGGICWKKF